MSSESRPEPRRSATARTWLQLLRAPNLFTVPGDPLAGYALASFGAFEPAVALAIGASICFYAAGLLDNDLADLAEDRAERPDRPLPSGAASPRAVAAVAVALTLAGLALAALLNSNALATAAVLAAAIVFYNHFTKRIPVVGALNMGACRGLSVLLGATAMPHGDLTFQLAALGRLNPLLIAAALTALYIAAVTNLARFETRAKTPPLAKWLPPVVLIAGVPIFISQIGAPTFWSATAIFLVAIASAFRSALALAQNPAAPVPPVIGRLIRVLLLLQSAICAAAGTLPMTLCAALLVTLWPISRAVSRRFYAS